MKDCKFRTGPKRPCRNFLRGRCNYGSKCHFEHVKAGNNNKANGNDDAREKTQRGGRRAHFDGSTTYMHDASTVDDESGMWSDEYFQMMEADSTPPERTALQFEDDSDDFEPPKPKSKKQLAKQQAMQEKKKKANETKQRRNSRKKKTTKEKAPAVETMQDEVPSVKTTQESKGDDQQASPLDEPGHIQAQAHGGEISQSAKAVPGRTRDNRRPPGPMQIGPHEKFADEDVGICQYAKNEEDCNFFPCNTHGSALAQNWVNREKFTEENDEIEDEHYGLDQIARKYGSGKRLMKINGETLCAVSQIDFPTCA
jgi:hypothetical protein